MTDSSFVDSYYKKILPFRAFGNNLSFQVSQDLFSSFAIDHGSNFLLRTLDEKVIDHSKTILDMGCGYGVLGLSLAKKDSTAEVHMVDRDALALAFTKENAKGNNIENITVYGSLGYDTVSEKFDLIVSNIPAKVGEPVLEHLLLDSQHHVTENGLIAIVVIKELEEFAENVLTDENIVVRKKEQRKGHTVFHYQFTKIITQKINAFTAGMYDRDFVEMPFVNAVVKTVYGLPEFDTPSFATDLLAEMFLDHKENVHHALFINPGQGFLPVIMQKKVAIETTSLFSRDLLQLENTKRNLIKNGMQQDTINTFHQIDVPHDLIIDAVVGVLRDEEGPDVHNKILEKLHTLLINQGHAFLAASSTSITRVESFIKQYKLFSVKERKKNKGYSAIHLLKIE